METLGQTPNRDKAMLKLDAYLTDPDLAGIGYALLDIADAIREQTAAFLAEITEAR
jgi:hypothetical protein